MSDTMMRGLANVRTALIASVPDRPDRGPDRSRAIGAILVEEGRLAKDDVDRVLNLASERQLRFGDAAIQLELIKQDDVAFALSRQFYIPALTRGPEGVSDDLIAGYDPQNPLLESLRSLRSNLMLQWYAESSQRVLSVVSPGRGEGRSWLVANLAIAFSQIGLRTLIIDADLRHPRQHQIFNLGLQAGLCELLTGRAGGDVARQIHPQLGLFVVTAGTPAPNPQELLSRALFGAVVARFAAQFDLVILDTPAAAENADAQIIAASGRAALLLAHKDHTQRSHVQSTVQGLIRAGVSVVGSVMSEH